MTTAGAAVSNRGDTNTEAVLDVLPHAVLPLLAAALSMPPPLQPAAQAALPTTDRGVQPRGLKPTSIRGDSCSTHGRGLPRGDVPAAVMRSTSRRTASATPLVVAGGSWLAVCAKLIALNSTDASASSGSGMAPGARTAARRGWQLATERRDTDRPAERRPRVPKLGAGFG